MSIFYTKHKKGTPSLRTTYAELSQKCNAVLLRQLVSWISYRTIENYSSFFVTEKSINEHESSYEVVEHGLPLFINLQVASYIRFLGECLDRFIKNCKATDSEGEIVAVLAEYQGDVVRDLTAALVKTRDVALCD